MAFAIRYPSFHCSCKQTLIDISCFLFSVFLMFSGHVIFPVGLGSQYFRFYCGDAASDFRSGDCNMGWKYMLAIARNALSILCPIFSYFSETENDVIYANCPSEKL